MAIETGNQGSVSITISGYTSTWTADVTYWAVEVEHALHDVTPMPRINSPKFVATTLQKFRGTLRFKKDDAIAAPMPSTTQGTITLYTKASTTKGYAAVPVLLYGIQAVGQSPGGAPWDYQASFIGSQSATDTAIAGA